MKNYKGEIEIVWGVLDEGLDNSTLFSPLNLILEHIGK